MAAPTLQGLAHYHRSVKRVLIGIMILNLIVTAIKFVVGALTGSIAVLADAFNALVDSSSNVIGLFGLRVASDPPDPEHPYGHRKYETIATLGIGGLMLLAGWEVLQDVFERLSGGQPPVVTTTSLALILLTLPLNIFIVWYEGRRGRELGSDVLLADAMSTRINIFVSLAALIGLLGSSIGLPWLDIVVALGIVVYVAMAAYRIISETSSVLTDSAVIDPHVVEDIARKVPGVWFATKVRSRGREDDVHLDLHVKVDPAMATEQAHAIASEVERRVKDQIPGVVDAVVHIEPGQHTPATEWETLAVQLRALADGLGLGVHNLHIDVLEGGYIVDVDVEIDSSLSLEISHRVVSEFESRARAAIPHLLEIVTHLEPTEPGDHPKSIEGAEAEALHRQIIQIADEVCGRGTAHHFILRHSHLPDRIDLSMHCEVAGDTSLPEAHLIAERVERRLRAELPQLEHVTIHVEPPEER
ncbi:MAG TPA: cation diffusion facilitator family transporter [Anaerolineae bacterium]|nr:cation diffusion facilitator family transporter [Anaerolineae bacterium]